MGKVFDDRWYKEYALHNRHPNVSPYCESVVGRLRVLFGYYYCPDCYQWKCTDKCARGYQIELAQIEDVIDRKKFDEAHELIAKLAIKTDEDEPELTRLRTKIFLYEEDDNHEA